MTRQDLQNVEDVTDGFDGSDFDKTPVCECGAQKFWRDCYNCDESGHSDHDCGEDCCCCLDPAPNVLCEICEGSCGWYQCSRCHPWED